MGLISTLKYIARHPLNRDHKLNAILRFIKWQVNTRLSHYPVVYAFTPRVNMIVAKGMTGATGNFYCGLHEFEDMSFVIHYLRPDDLFVDVGANIGSYTLLASGQVGASTVAFEPVPTTFQQLQLNLSLNHLEEKVEAHNKALGSANGTVPFTRSLDTVNHVAIPGEHETIAVEVKTLDDVLRDKRVPALLKIDVEGYETEVIKGALETLVKEGLNAVIIELNGSGSRYGYDETWIHEQLQSAGFQPHAYEPFTRQLTKLTKFGHHNTIYIKDSIFVEERLRTAERIGIRGHQL